jgi:hypothetical protein
VFGHSSWVLCLDAHLLVISRLGRPNQPGSYGSSVSRVPSLILLPWVSYKKSLSERHFSTAGRSSPHPPRALSKTPTLNIGARHDRPRTLPSISHSSTSSSRGARDWCDPSYRAYPSKFTTGGILRLGIEQFVYLLRVINVAKRVASRCGHCSGSELYQDLGAHS